MPSSEEEQVERKLGSDGVPQVDGPGCRGHTGVDIHMYIHASGQTQMGFLPTIAGI